MDVRETPDGVLLTVRVQPRASLPGVLVRDGVVVVRVGAPPEGGRATEEARRTLAKALGVRSADVTLRTGHASRTKVFEVGGISPARVREVLRGPEGE